MKNSFLKLTGLIALFFMLSSLSITKIIPEQVTLAQPVNIAIKVYYVLGGMGFIYLFLTLIKNRTLWFTRFRNRKVVKRNNLYFISIIFIAYFLFHLFMILSENISNVDFTWTYLSLNLNLLTERYVPLLLIFIVGIPLIIKIPESKKSWKLFNWVPTIKREDIFVSLLTSLAFSDYLTRRLIWNTSFGARNSRGVYQLLYSSERILARYDFMRLLGDYVFVFLIIFIVSYLVFKGMSALFTNKNNFALAFTSSLFWAIIFNYLIQSAIKSDSGVPVHGTVVAGATVFQIIILSLIFMLAYLLINRYVAATAFIIVAGALFSLANMIKFSERKEPVYVSELSWLSNPQILLSFVDRKMIMIAIGALIVLILVVVFLSRKFFTGKLMTWKVRGFVLLALVLVYLTIYQNFKTFTKQDEQISVPLLTRYINVANGDVLWKGSPHTARTKSLSYVWLRQIYGEAMEQPTGYSKEKIKEIQDKYSKRAEEINIKREHDIQDQTVIYILSESLSNPNRIQGITLSENPLQNIDNIKESATGGHMYSNGYGGGTANMEAQTLDGLPMANYSSQISIINSDVFPSMPFIPSISNYFPEKIALHPENATNYNRNSIYNKLGFDHFYALSGTDKADLLTDQETLDGKVSDAQTYRDVLDKIDPSKSQFFSVLTMQNHMPYTSYSGSSTIIASGEGYSEAQNQLLENYVRKISDTDKATKEFLTELEKIDKKITLVFYGDHLSNVFPSDYAGFKEDPLNAYKTDYFIWTNKGNTTDKQVDLSSATFTPALFEATGSKVSPYYALLSDVMWEVPAAYNSPLSSTVTLTEEQSKRMEDLKLVQYDLTSGKHYLKEDSPFFKLEK
ncbi:LTA synthase family protein [Lactococcus garvieae]|uniref:LTA synthase family protein n=2 Tax=Streptococcaceae TaxID=1300 RepID=UPI00385484C1